MSKHYEKTGHRLPEQRHIEKPIEQPNLGQWHIAEAREQPAPENDGSDRLKHVDGDHKENPDFAKDTVKIRKAGISAAEFAYILMKKVFRSNYCAVDTTDDISRYRDRNNQYQELHITLRAINS